VFALGLIGSSFMELPIAHKTLLRWVVALIIGVKALEKVVAADKEEKVVAIDKELAQRVWIIEPQEVSTSPATVVLLRVDT
jgi:hypothetical protein